MVLALLPVGVLLGFTIVEATADWRQASSLHRFQESTKLSFATSELAARLADERTAAALAALWPSPRTLGRLRASRGDVDRAMRRDRALAAGWSGPVDLSGRLDAAARELAALRVQGGGGSRALAQRADAYSTIVGDLFSAIRLLDAARLTESSGSAADAYVAMVQAVEAAERERVDVAAALAEPGRAALKLAESTRWAALETTYLAAFRDNASGPLDADLEAVLYSPAGIKVQALRNALAAGAPVEAGRRPATAWFDASGRRIRELQTLQLDAQRDLAAAASRDLSTARTRSIRDVALSIAVLALVTGLALWIRRSITRPLAEVSEGARALTAGDLSFDVGYAGRDEIGDVAAAFRDLHLTAGRLASEIRTMNAAVVENRLDHRAGTAALEGTWAQLLDGLNDTMAAFAASHERRERAEQEFESFFNLSLDLLCVGGFDGYFKRVNPAFERTLGYTEEELLSRPYSDFQPPEERGRTQAALDELRHGAEMVGFENRFVCRDGSERRLEWNMRAAPGEGLVYAVARDVTESRSAADAQAALRRVATLVAGGAAPERVWTAVIEEVRGVLPSDAAGLVRYEPDATATLVASTDPSMVGDRAELEGQDPATIVLETGRAVRFDDSDALAGNGADRVGQRGRRASVAAPLIVEGRVWGALVAVTTSDRRLPQGAEARLSDFAELVATAVANAAARVELRGFADEQAALRRVATLVAEGAPAGDVFSAVAAEVGRLLGADVTVLGRFDAGAVVTTVGSWSATGIGVPDQSTAVLGGPDAWTRVRETGRAVGTVDSTGASHEAADPVGGIDLGSWVGAPIVVDGALWGAILAGTSGTEPFTQDVEERLAQFTELIATAIANAEHRAELTASRARVIAAADDTRRRLERDLHDGIQQRLVSLSLALRTLGRRVPDTLPDLRASLAQAAEGLTEALSELQEISRGIHPAILSKGGLAPALRTLARRAAIPVEVRVASDVRLPDGVEVAAYYVVAEALTNAVKHAKASKATVCVEAGDGVLRLSVRDDGIGGADPTRGSGLIGLTDRVEALGGRLELVSPPGEGTLLRATLPTDQRAPGSTVSDTASGGGRSA